MIARRPTQTKILDPDFEFVRVGGELPVQRFELFDQRIPRVTVPRGPMTSTPSSIAPENRAKVSPVRGTAPASQSRKKA